MTRKKGAPQRLNDMYEADPGRSKDVNKEEEAATDNNKDEGDRGGEFGNNTAGAMTESACVNVDKQLQQTNATRRLSSLENTAPTPITSTSKSFSSAGSDKKIAATPSSSSPSSLSSSCSSALGLMSKFRRVATSTTTATTYPSIPDPKQSSQSTSTNNKRQQQQQQQQSFCLDTMMRQHLFEQYQQNNWMYSQQQRSESNCLSKSKAERYRWCVPTPQQQQQQAASTSTSASTTTTATNNNNSNKLQQPNSNHGSKQQQQNNSHVTNLKRSANFSTCDVSPMQEKLFSSVFSGASQFSCRDCGSSFDTLVDLTVHMNHTGHYRDLNKNNNTAAAAASTPASSNHKKSATVGNSNNSNAGGIPNSKKRRLSDQQQQHQQEEKSSENVLTCMECKHSFDSLQDLSVHMMKTRHYENVPSLRTWPQQNHHFNTNTAVTVNNSNNNDHKNTDNNSATTNSRKKSSSSSDENDKQQSTNGKTNNHTTAAASNNNKNSNPLSQQQFASMLTNMPNASALAAYYSAMIYFYPWLSAASLQNSLLTASILHQPAPPLPFLPNQFAPQNPFSNLDNVHQQYAAAFQLRNLFTTNNFNNMNPFNINNAITNNSNANGINNNNNNRPNSNGSNNNVADKSCSEQIAKYSKLLFSNKLANQQQKQQQNEDKQKATANNSNSKTQTDFINMLEGTVHSALSRVQSSPNPNHSNNKTITKNEVTSGNNSNRSSVSPLDLTLRRENSPVVNNVKNKQQQQQPGEGKSTVVKREFAAYTGNLPPKDPLQSIKEMFDKRTTAASTKNNNNSNLIKLQHQLQQKVAMTASVKSKEMSASNPLREMMKIVNDTDKYNNSNNCGSAKAVKQINSGMDTRKFGLDDLVVLPTNKVTKQNPIHDLQKMVNMKLNLPQNISPRQHKTQSTKPLHSHLQVQLVQEPLETKTIDKKVECNHQLLLLQSYFLQKYSQFIAKSEKIKTSEKEETNQDDDVDDNDEGLKKILQEASINKAQFKIEVKRMIEVYNTTSHLPFVKKKDGEILCFSCGVCGETAKTCCDFIKHINDEHINKKLDAVDTCRKPNSPLIQAEISIKQENGQQYENKQRQKQNEKQVDGGAGGEVILAS